MSVINPFSLLGVNIKSKREEVKKVFKELALICHPDKGGNEEEMKILYNAYQYVIEQISFQEHGRTMEEEEECFKELRVESGKLIVPHEN